MNTENKVLMQMARESLKGKWGVAIGGFALYGLVTIIIQIIPIVGGLALFIISGPLILGLMFFSLSLSRGQEVRVKQIFDGFDNFVKALVTYLLMILYIFLWSLLLIIPGIIAGLSYSMVFFILSDNKDMKPKDVLRKSKEMMNGYKWKFFCLQLRFIGWGILSILTLGIGFLWLVPYMQVSFAKFYDDLKNKTIKEQVQNETVPVESIPASVA